MPISSPSPDGARHVVLVGLMGSGKTTVGRLLADRLGRPLIDSDEQVERREGRSVREIFETDGEAVFRRLEAAALAEAVACPTPSVIAAAGGVVLDAANRRLLREAGTVVWLRADAAVLGERAQSGEHRPLLADDPEGVLRRMQSDRGELYAEVADHAIDVGERTPDQVARAVEELLA